MSIFLIISACLLWGAAFLMLFRRILLAPGLSYLGLLVLSFASKDGLPLLPVNNVILLSWLSITIVVMLTILLQTQQMRASVAGMGYMTIGAVAGMIVGLLGFSIAEDITMRYSIMVVGTAAGTILGYLMYRNTPAGRSAQDNFLPYLAAKGFPVAITVMQAGVALVLTLALYSE